MFTWRGQFSPQLIEHILINYSSKNDVVFDPFVGSGTVLYECALNKLEASGCEINPAAVSFAKIYELVNQPKDKINNALKQLDSIIYSHIDNLPLFNNSEKTVFEEQLIDILNNTENEIMKIILMAYVTGMDFKTKKTDTKRIHSVWNSLKNNINNLPYSNKKISCYQSDSRKSPLQDNSVNLVITSPPYINVFNYHQNYRKSVELIGIDVLKIAKSEIGANRKFRQNRFLTVVQYCMDISQVFIELRRVCKTNAKIIFIVGRESNVKKTAFKNAKLITSVAKQCGFNLEGSQERVFKNKFGNLIYEEILRFSINRYFLNSKLDFGRDIGRKALNDALSYANSDVITDIKDAYIKSKNIKTSPILETKGI
jgi:DNA modification methylase